MGDDLQRQLNRLGGDMAEMKDDVAEIKEGVIEHRIRLENGTKVFLEHADRIKTVEDIMRPQPPSMTKIVAISFAVFVALSGALWALAHMLRDRPTTDQLREVIQAQDDLHEAKGHQTIRDNVASIQQEQGAQRQMITDVKSAQQAQSTKIDEILVRLPKSRARRRAPR